MNNLPTPFNRRSFSKIGIQSVSSRRKPILIKFLHQKMVSKNGPIKIIKAAK
jgi:hypothetical protein